MKLAIKWLAIALASVVTLFVLAIIAVTVWIDPNHYKAPIEKLAAQQGVPLKINGDISWQFYPSIGFAVSDSQLLDASGAKTLLQIEAINTSLALVPLLRKQIIVEQVLIEGLIANLEIDQHGNGNWQHLVTEDTNSASPSANDSNDEPPTGAPLELAAESIRINRAALHLHNQQAKSEITLAQFNLTIAQLNLNNQAFPVTADWQLKLDDQTTGKNKTLFNRGDLTTQLSIDPSLTQFTASDGIANVAIGKNSGQLTTPAKAEFALHTMLGETLKIESQVKVAPFNAKQWLAQLSDEPLQTSDPTALTQVGLSALVSGTPENLLINDISIQLDDTKINGRARLQSPQQLMVNLTGTNIDIDRYTPPEPTTQPTASNTPTETEATPLDLSALNELKARVSIAFNQIIANKLNIENLLIRATAEDGVANLEQLSADFYQGKIVSSGSVNARSPITQINLQGNMQDIALEPLLKDLNTSQSSRFLLTGTSNGDFTLASQGATVEALVSNLNANLQANTQALQLAPINIERLACQAMALVQGEQLSQKNWPKITDLQNLTTEITLTNQVATIKTLNAGIEQLKLTAKGKVDLLNKNLDVNLPITITKPITEQPGCPASSNWVIGKALSLVRCKGSLLEPLEACGLDNRAIREAAKDYVEAKAKEKLEPHKQAAEKKIDEKKQQLKDKINEELGDGADQLLKDLFKKKKN